MLRQQIVYLHNFLNNIVEKQEKELGKN